MGDCRRNWIVSTAAKTGKARNSSPTAKITLQ